MPTNVSVTDSRPIRWPRIFNLAATPEPSAFLVEAVASYHHTLDTNSAQSLFLSHWRVDQQITVLRVDQLDSNAGQNDLEDFIARSGADSILHPITVRLLIPLR